MRVTENKSFALKWDTGKTLTLVIKAFIASVALECAGDNKEEREYSKNRYPFHGLFT